MDAVDFAIGLAKKDNAKLVSFTVMHLPSFYGWSAIESPKEWQEKDRAEIEQWSEKIKKTAHENNVDIETKFVESPMSVDGAIVDYADKENVDLIVVGTRRLVLPLPLPALLTMITLRLNRLVIISVMYAELYLIVMRLVKIANSRSMITKEDVLYVLTGHLYFSIFIMVY
jgi:Universal stress protein family